MDNKGLLFIPDISGFTRFVSQTEIEHSRLIIQELLEVMINANRIGLEISEIEGDAILFYKFGESPQLEEIYRQVKEMFCAFHSHLGAYHYRRFCQCKACTSAIDLTLKVITHYGEFTGYNVKNFNKLIGKDIIVAHQLLKNDIEQHEYWLITTSLQASQPNNLAQWMRWNSNIKQTENGEISFYYTQLSELKNTVTPALSPQVKLSDKIKMISLSKEYKTGIITLFHATGDFTYRSRWQEGVKSVEEIDHLLPRIGMRCRLTLEDGAVTLYSSSYSYHPEKIEFSETDEKSKNITCYTLEKTGEDTTRLTLDFYLGKNGFNKIIFSLTKKKRMEEQFQQSLLNLEMFARELTITEGT